MKKKLTLTLICLAYLVSSIAQPVPEKLSERLQKNPSLENLRSFLPPKTTPQKTGEDWYEPDVVYMFGTNAPIGRHTFSYANGKCLFHIIEYSKPQWPNLKYLYFYDAQNNIQELLAQEWNGDFERWENLAKTTFDYNAQNNCIERLLQFWKLGWANDSKSTYTYDAQNNMTEQFSQYWEGEQWKNDLKHEYLYDSLNNMSEELIERWGYIEQKWINWKQSIYLYDSLNNLIEKQQDLWSMNAEEWMHLYKWIFIYDTQNNRTEELYQVFNEWDEWENAERVSYIYDENNNAIFGVYQAWINNTWIDDLGTLYLHYNNMKSIWEYFYLHHFSATYINMNNQSIQDRSTESAIKLYPNPVSGILHIETGSNVAPEIKVFSIQGVLLLQAKGNEINISSLDRGIYFAEIDGVCRKVVKQ